jgi:tellurite resistance protein TehA-like permease
MLVAICQYWYLFMNKTLLVKSMTPSWILPIFPVMLTGTLASILAADQPPDQRLPMIVAGVAAQGLGWTVAVMLYAVCLVRLFEYGFTSSERQAWYVHLCRPARFHIPSHHWHE